MERDICIMQGDLKMVLTNCRYSDDMLRWILSKENALDFLYQTWRHTDYLLTSEFADLLYDELTVRKDGCNE